MIGEVSKTCMKCGHKRTPEDGGPPYACPECGTVYAKAEASERARQAAAAQPELQRQNETEFAARIDRERRLITMAHVVYALYLVPIGLTALAGVVVAHRLRSKAHGSWLESHFRWQIRTFWGAILATIAIVVAGKLLLSSTMLFAAGKGAAAGVIGVVGVGTLGVVAVSLLALWCVYRVVRGWINLAQAEAVGGPLRI